MKHRQLISKFDYFVFLCFLPFLLLVTFLKPLRAPNLASEKISVISLLKLDFSVCFAFMFFLMLCHMIFRNRWLRLGLYVIALVGALLFLLFEIATYMVFKESGFILNWSLVIFGVERAAKMGSMANHGVHFLQGFVGVALIVYFIFVPRMLSTKLALRGAPALNIGVLFTGLLTMLIATAAWSLNPGSPKVPNEVMRGSIVNLFWTYAEARRLQETAFDFSKLKSDSNVKRFELNRVADKPLKNVVIIIMESTRDRSVDPYVNLGATPYFAELAEQGVLFKNAYTTFAHTSRAIFSILCGQYPRVTNDIPETRPSGVPTACLPDLLRSLGYETVFFQSATEDFEDRQALVANMGFQSFFPLEMMDTNGYQKANLFGFEDDIMLPVSERWLADHEKRVTELGKGGPFLASYLTVTPHFHYDPIARYPHKTFDENVKYNRYLNSLYYQDHFIRKLLNQYKALGLFDDTVFVLLGDHGQGFHEHGLWGHGNIVYEEAARIPFLLLDKDLPSAVVEHPTSVLDVVPTLLERLGYQAHVPPFPGQVAVQENRAENDIYLQCISPSTCSAVIEQESMLKLIHNYGRREDELFYLSRDPNEQRNLIDDANYKTDHLRLLQKITRKVDELKTAIDHGEIRSWALKQETPIPVTVLPRNAQTDALSLVSGDFSKGVLAYASSKKVIKGGDSLRLTYFFKTPAQSVCMVSFSRHVHRHGVRADFIKNHNQPFTALSHKIHLFESLEKLKLRIDLLDLPESSCNTQFNSDILLDHQRTLGRHGTSTDYFELSYPNTLSSSVIELPVQSVGSLSVFQNERTRETFKVLAMEELDLEQVSIGKARAHDYFAFQPEDGALLNELQAGIESFKNNNIAYLGEYLDAEFSKAYRSDLDDSKILYRYKMFFSKGHVVDVRIVLYDQGRFGGMYYHSPWENGLVF